MGGYKTPASATAVYLAARKKLLASSEAGDGNKKGKANDVGDDTSRESKKTRKKATGNGVVKLENVTEDIDIEANSKPKKRAKKGPRKRAASSDEANEEVNGGNTDEKPTKRAKNSTDNKAVRSEEAIEAFLDEEEELRRPIKQEPHDELVDMNLFISAAHFLQNQGEDNA